ncbi:hypothetical protein BLL42_27665 (plasmid) [Pseudomonas frederiksbergensis]|uniref:Uncharacterized protein n=1 Tax=Pseudomonas frederiksbergensis TaxID=104087 RepID=A0A1J0EUD0_9PSED|nr:hypothetical protein [Pseudomonas frederiksbergensis]APC19511.1 hypothetical protein BLL42_27665 [Pseudomonas frederiksbergensis]
MALTPRSFNKVMFRIVEVISYVPMSIEALHESCAVSFKSITVEDIKEVLDGMIRIGAVSIDPCGMYFDCTAYTLGDIHRGKRAAV